MFDLDKIATISLVETSNLKIYIYGGCVKGQKVPNTPQKNFLKQEDFLIILEPIMFKLESN